MFSTVQNGGEKIIITDFHDHYTKLTAHLSMKFKVKI